MKKKSSKQKQFKSYLPLIGSVLILVTLFIYVVSEKASINLIGGGTTGGKIKIKNGSTVVIKSNDNYTVNSCWCLSSKNQMNCKVTYKGGRATGIVTINACTKCNSDKHSCVIK